MRVDVIKDEVYAVLQRQPGVYLSAYDVAVHLQQSYPDVAEDITTHYSNSSHTLASFVANALKTFARRDPHRINQIGKVSNGKWAWVG